MRVLILWLFFTHLAGIPQAMGVSPVRAMLRENRLEEAAGVCRQFEVLITSDRDNFITCAWVYYRSNRIDSGDQMVDKARGSDSQIRLLKAYRWMKLKTAPPPLP